MVVACFQLIVSRAMDRFIIQFNNGSRIIRKNDRLIMIQQAPVHIKANGHLRGIQAV